MLDPAPLQTLWFETALLPTGWAPNVRITIAAGRIVAVLPGTAAAPTDARAFAALPGLANVHSHAFQRGMAGLAETAGPAGDNFWTWRDIMYRFLDRLTPADMGAIAALAYMEMLENGFTRVGEFHYLHHDCGGAAYGDAAEMAHHIVVAANRTGIGLTLLPVFYAHAGFGGTPPSPGQKRFVCGLDQFADLCVASGNALKSLPDAVLGIAPHSLRAVTPAELTALISLAAGRPIHMHIAEQTGEVDACLAWCGARPMQWLLANAQVGPAWCLIHATHINAAETAGLASSGAVAGLCPITEANLGDGVFPTETYHRAAGRFGIGTDSNIVISAADELRGLEYAQRLTQRRRNVCARAPGQSTGATLYSASHTGGAQALGVSDGGLAVGQSADIIALDKNHPSLIARQGNALLDAYVFAGGTIIDRVWRHGQLVVQDGRHIARDAILAAYRQSLTRILA